jgi:hypothetical protein
MKFLNTYTGVLVAATLAVVVWFVFLKKDEKGESALSEFFGKKRK